MAAYRHWPEDANQQQKRYNSSCVHLNTGNPLLLTRSQATARAKGHLAKLSAASYVILDAVNRAREAASGDAQSDESGQTGNRGGSDGAIDEGIGCARETGSGLIGGESGRGDVEHDGRSPASGELFGDGRTGGDQLCGKIAHDGDRKEQRGIRRKCPETGGLLERGEGRQELSAYDGEDDIFEADDDDDEEEEEEHNGSLEEDGGVEGRGEDSGENKVGRSEPAWEAGEQKVLNTDAARRPSASTSNGMTNHTTGIAQNGTTSTMISNSTSEIGGNVAPPKTLGTPPEASNGPANTMANNEILAHDKTKATSNQGHVDLHVEGQPDAIPSGGDDPTAEDRPAQVINKNSPDSLTDEPVSADGRANNASIIAGKHVIDENMDTDGRADATSADASAFAGSSTRGQGSTAVSEEHLSGTVGDAGELTDDRATISTKDYDEARGGLTLTSTVAFKLQQKAPVYEYTAARAWLLYLYGWPQTVLILFIAAL